MSVFVCVDMHTCGNVNLVGCMHICVCVCVCVCVGIWTPACERRGEGQCVCVCLCLCSHIVLVCDEERKQSASTDERELWMYLQLVPKPVVASHPERSTCVTQRSSLRASPVSLHSPVQERANLHRPPEREHGLLSAGQNFHLKSPH